MHLRVPRLAVYTQLIPSKPSRPREEIITQNALIINYCKKNNIFFDVVFYFYPCTKYQTPLYLQYLDESSGSVSSYNEPLNVIVPFNL